MKRKVTQVVAAQEMSEGAGVRIRRSLGGPELNYLDPFLLLDEFKSDDKSDYLAGFPDHPHRGFETVTYMLAGAMEHRDHKGNHGLLTDGSAQWMTAGRGIIHSEMPKQKEGLMWGFQLWVNLPARLKMTEPRYQDIASASIPETRNPDGSVARVIAGQSGGASGAVTGIATEPLYLDVNLPANGRLRQAIPEGHTAFLYVYQGTLEVGGGEIGEGRLAVLSAGDSIEMDAPRGARFLLIAARPLNEPMARSGPFVMNTMEEIHQAFRDYREGMLAL